MKKVSIISALVGSLVLIVPHVFAQTYYSYSLYSNLSTNVCTNITRDLSYGARGSDVTQLQGFLINQNYPGSGGWMITGYFGASTQAAVRNFQRLQGLSQTGAADGATRAAIYRVSCGGNAYAPNYYQSQYPYLYTLAQTNPFDYSYGNTYNNYKTYPNYTNNTYPYNNYGYNPYPYMYNNNNPYTYNSTTYPPSCNTYAYPYNCGGYFTVSPTIFFFNPSSGIVGSTVTIFGAGFTTTGNAVHFGSGIIANLNSIDGETVSFTVPAQLIGYGSQPTVRGTYNVSFVNGNGITSNTATFTVQ